MAQGLRALPALPEDLNSISVTAYNSSSRGSWCRLLASFKHLRMRGIETQTYEQKQLKKINLKKTKQAGRGGAHL